MNHAKMHLADFVRIIVNQRDDPICQWPFSPQLFVDFPLHPGEIRILVEGEQSLIAIIHMASDPNRSFGHKALLARFLSAYVPEHLAATNEDRVRDYLFQARI